MLTRKKHLCFSLVPVLALSACGSGDAEVDAASEIAPGKYEIRQKGAGIAAMFKGPGSGIKTGTTCLSSEQAENLSGLLLDDLFGPELECESTFGENGQGVYNGKRVCVTPENPRGSATLTMDYTGKSTAQSFQFDVQMSISATMPEAKSFNGKPVTMIMSGKRIGDCDEQEDSAPLPSEPDDTSYEDSEAIDAADAAAEAAADSSDNVDY